MKICPSCKITYQDDVRYCPGDGARLVTEREETIVCPGEVLEKRYEIVQKTGKDGNWTVYQSKVIATGQKILVKTMPVSLLVEEQSLEQFKKRLIALQKIVHPALVRILDFGVFEGNFFYVATERVEGQSLKKLMDDVGEFSIPLSLTIIKQVLAILQFLHENEILHLALTPMRIFLVQSPADSHFIKLDVADPVAIQRCRPYENSVPPGSEYTAPEIFYGYPAGTQSDVYSAGVIFYQILTGLFPYPQEVFLKLPQSKFPSPLSLNGIRPELKRYPKVEKVVLQAVAWIPKNRFPDIASFSRALKDIKFPKPRRKRRLAALLLVIGLLYFIPPGLYQRLRNFFEQPAQQEQDSTFEYKGVEHSSTRMEEANSSYLKEREIIRQKGPKPHHPYLFAVNTSYISELNRGEMPEGLWNDFKANNYGLPADVEVTIQCWDKEWLLASRDSCEEYLIVKETDDLKIYLHEMRKVMGGKTEVGRIRQEVDVPSFYIDCTEVTNAQYRSFVRETGHAPPPYWVSGEPPQNQENYPVVEVTWYDASLYAEWCCKQLPTEAQWERAAHGDKVANWPWGDEFMNYANIGTRILSPPGMFKDQWQAGQWKCPCGVVDMVGNVWEWTDTWYDPEVKQDRVIKGGSFLSNLEKAKTCSGEGFFPFEHRQDIGFRCVRLGQDK